MRILKYKYICRLDNSHNHIIMLLTNPRLTEVRYHLHLHLSDAFIQSDLHCIQVTVSTFYQLLLSLGLNP